MTPAETIEALQADHELLKTQLAQAIDLREDALGRAARAEREIIRLRGQRRILANELHARILAVRQADHLFDEIIHALSMPPLLWPFAGAGSWVRSSWRAFIAEHRPNHKILEGVRP